MGDNGNDTARRRSWWGWGYTDAAVDDSEVAGLAGLLSARYGRSLTAHPAPVVGDVELRAPRVSPPSTLAAICTTDPFERALHTHGRSYRDIVRNLHRRLAHPPDLVARPRTEADVVALLDWCSTANVAAIAFGGGSSVVGGVEGDVGEGFAGVVSIDTTAMDRVVELDELSRSARVQAGAIGPVLEDQLRPNGLTLRHFPQSFEVSSVGGWLATRAGGHFATGPTHIDDLVESMRVVTPTGVSESRRLPGSGAGPSHDRLFLGSEGSLGVITEAWLRVQARPRWKGSAGVHFARFDDGVAAVRALAQSGLQPANCRLLDGGEAALSASTPGVGGLLVLGFESADHPVGPWLDRAVELVLDHGGTIPDGPSLRDEAELDGRRGGSVDAWRSSFVRMPYLRDALVRCEVLSETFETACTWDRFAELHATVTEAVGDALDRLVGDGTRTDPAASRNGAVTCRFTHAYPDGCAPYFTVIAPSRFGDEIAIWDEVKAAASDALLAAGGTITHHHAVGRDHDAWYRRQRTEPFGRVLAAAKATLDPAGICNPGVIA